jgi:hypothetical protein
MSFKQLQRDAADLSEPALTFLSAILASWTPGQL